MRGRSGERGSAIIEVLGIGFLVLLLLVPVLIGAGRLQSAGEAVRDAAHTAALVVARTGDLEAGTHAAAALAPAGAAIDISSSGDRVSVTVGYDVTLAGPEGFLSRTVEGRATARISPYRSTGG